MMSALIVILLVTIAKTILRPISETSKRFIIEVQIEKKIKKEGKANKALTKTTHNNTLRTKYTK